MHHGLVFTFLSYSTTYSKIGCTFVSLAFCCRRAQYDIGDVQKAIAKIEAHVEWRVECYKEEPAEHVAATKFCVCTENHDNQGNTLVRSYVFRCGEICQGCAF